LKARIALAVIALALVGAAPAAGATVIDQIDDLTIDSGPGALAQDGKLHPGAPSSCNSPKTVPAVDPGTFNITAFGEESFINEATCLTIEYSTADASCQANGLFSASYKGGAFDNSAIQDLYAGDVGAAPAGGAPVSYSVTVPPRDSLGIAFNMSVAGAGCSDFDVKVSSDRPWLQLQLPLKGHPFVGETLSTFDTYWLGATSFTHQWRRCAADGTSCADIPGATAATYVPVPDDVGHMLRAHATASDGVATSSADSMAVLVGVQFDAADGQSISASDPTQNGRLSRGFVSSSCSQPPKPTPALSDPTHTRFYDAFRHTNGSDSTICAMASIEYPPNCTSERPFSAAYLPGFDPATSVRTNYLADSGLNGTNGERTIRYSFGVPAGSAYDVVVTTFAAGATCPQYDLRLGTASPSPTSAPSLEGTAQAGQTLTAGDGTWTGAPSSFGYQWQRCFGDGSGCGDIPGATAKTLTLTDRNVGDSFRVRVTATEGIGSASKLSAPTGAVVEAPAGPPPPGPPGPPDPPAFAGIALKPVTKVVGSKGLVTLSLVCPAEAVVGCGGTDVVRLGKASLGSKPFAMGPGKTARVGITLSKALRKRLAKRKRLNATQVVNSFDARGVSVRTSGKLTLKAKAKRRG
jgi:hypothetical protein